MFLFETSTIRKAIRDVLQKRQGTRYAIVAFVGKDALDFIAEPDGLTVYCWDNVTATHPDGVRKLRAKGATVYFVSRLHMKLFWSERGGAVIGSPNLTSNALGTGVGLLETAYFVKRPDAIPITAVLDSLKAARRLVTDSVLASYTKKYNHASARRDEFKTTMHDKVSLDTFATFSKLSNGVKWRLNCWKTWTKVSNAALKAVAVLAENDAVSKKPLDFVSAAVEVESKPSLGEWVLCCRVGRNGSLGRVDWLFTHTIVPVRKNSKFWHAIEVKSYHTEPPFNCAEARFKEAFKLYAAESNLLENQEIVMNQKRVKRLAEIYNNTTISYLKITRFA